MANPYPGRNIPTACPTVRKIDIRSLSYGMSGAEGPYPVYQFAGGRARLEYPRHNPFNFDTTAILTEGGGALLTESGGGLDFG